MTPPTVASIHKHVRFELLTLRGHDEGDMGKTSGVFFILTGFDVVFGAKILRS